MRPSISSAKRKSTLLLLFEEEGAEDEIGSSSWCCKEAAVAPNSETAITNVTRAAERCAHAMLLQFSLW